MHQSGGVVGFSPSASIMYLLPRVKNVRATWLVVRLRAQNMNCLVERQVNYH